jgi:hypothetical protein
MYTLKINSNSNNILKINNSAKITKSYSKEVVHIDYGLIRSAPFNSDRIAFVEYLDRANREKLANSQNNTIIDNITVVEFIYDTIIKLDISILGLERYILLNMFTLDYVKKIIDDDITKIANAINNGEGSIKVLVEKIFPNTHNLFYEYIETTHNKYRVDIYNYITITEVINYIKLTNYILKSDIDILTVYDNLSPEVLEYYNGKVVELLKKLLELPYKNYYKTRILLVIDNFSEYINTLITKYEYLSIVNQLDYNKITYIGQLNLLKILFGDTSEYLLDIDYSVL